MWKNYNEFLEFKKAEQRKYQAKLKRTKVALIVTSGALLVSIGLFFGALGLQNSKGESTSNDGFNTEISTSQSTESVSPKTKQQAFNDMQKVLNTQLKTYEDYFKDDDGVRRKYKFVKEQDLLELSSEMANVLEDYFEVCGAIHWTSNKTEQFWPENIEYLITAIAYRESSYRTNVTHPTSGAEGLTQIKDYEVFPTVGNWLNLPVWKGQLSHINFEVGEVDLFNPTTSIEYTYYNMGYLLANRLKKEKKFTDIDGKTKCIWDTLEYSEEMQNRLIIAMHKEGIGNVTNAIYGRPNEKGVYVPLEDYIYSDYVEDVLDKANNLIDTYANQYSK